MEAPRICLWKFTTLQFVSLWTWGEVWGGHEGKICTLSPGHPNVHKYIWQYQPVRPVVETRRHFAPHLVVIYTLHSTPAFWWETTNLKTCYTCTVESVIFKTPGTYVTFQYFWTAHNTVTQLLYTQCKHPLLLCSQYKYPPSFKTIYFWLNGSCSTCSNARGHCICEV